MASTSAASGSAAATVPTALVFSTTENSTAPVPASVVRAVTSNSGSSFTSSTVTVSSWSVDAAPLPVPLVAVTVSV